jgi:hypothetical protein
MSSSSAGNNGFVHNALLIFNSGMKTGDHDVKMDEDNFTR